MANNKITFTIEGNASNGIQAISKLVDSFEKLPGVVTEINQAVSKFSKNSTKLIDRLDAAMEKLNTSLKSTASSSKSAEKGLESLSKDAKLLEDRANRAADAMNRIRSSGGRAAGAGTVNATGAVGAQLAPPAAGPAVTPMPIPNVSYVGSAAVSPLALIPNIMNKATPLVLGFAAKAKSAFASLGPTISGAFAHMPTASMMLAGMGAKISTFTASFSKSLYGIRNGYMAVVDSVRLSAQAITNLGRTMTFFITLPIMFILGGAAKTAIDFEDALVRVRKTAGLTFKQLEEVKQGIQDIAIWTPTAHTELATMAEQLGQLGVQNPANLVKFTDLMNKVAVTTDLSSQEVAESIGRIANAFQVDLNADAAVDTVNRIVNVLNLLENTTAASADELVTSMLKSAQAFSMMEVSIPSSMALSAFLIDVGLSAEETGTALRNMVAYVNKNAEAVSSALKTYDKYATSEKVVNELNKDAVQVWIDLADAAEGGGVEAIRALNDIANLRGGRALSAMANDLDRLRKYMKDANKEWDTATSLQIEYEMAILSTKNQLAILKNNFNDVAITVGDAVLPVINRLVQIIIPGLRMISAAFKKLQPQQQLMIVGFVLLAAVVGPVLLIFGQLVHSLGLMFLGFGQLMKIFPAVIMGLGTIGKAVLGLAGFFVSTPGLIIAAVAGIIFVLSQLGVDIAGIFTNIANTAATWGQNLMATYANGLARGFAFVLNIVSKIAKAIAGFFESHSPPKVGPLSTIDKWGGALMRTYLNGFKNADFSILSEVGGIIKDVLTSAISGGDDGAMKGALTAYASARQALSKLISVFNKTGKVSQAMLKSVTGGLGYLAGDVSKLITLWLKYNKLQEDIAALEDRRKGIKKTYNAEIAAIGRSNMTLEQKVQAIRQAQMAQDEGLRATDAEQQKLEEQRDTVKEQLDFQKNLIDAMMEQDDIMAQLKETMDKLAGAAGDIADTLGEIGEGLGGAIEDPFEKATEQFETFKEKIETGQRILAGFFNGLSGKDVPIEATGLAGNEDAIAMYEKLYELGQLVDTIRDKFVAAKDQITVWGINIGTWVDYAKQKWAEISSGGEGGQMQLPPALQEFVNWITTNWPVIVAGFQNGLNTVIGILSPFWESLQKGWAQVKQIFDNGSTITQPLVEAFGNLWAALQGLWVAFQPILSVILQVLGVVLAAIGAVLGAVINGILRAVLPTLTFIINGITTVISGVVNIVSGIVNFISGLFLLIQAIFTKDIANIDNIAKAAFGKMWEGIQQIFLGAWQVIMGIFSGILGGIITFIGNFIQGVIDFFVNLYDELVGHSIIPDMMQDIWEAITTKLDEIITSISTWVTNVIKTITDMIGDMVQAGRDIIQGLWNGMLEIWDSIKGWFNTAINEMPGWLKKLLGIASPSKVFAELGRNTMEGYLVGLKDAFGRVSGFMSSSFGDPSFLMQSTLGLSAPAFAAPVAGAGNIEIHMHLDGAVIREDKDIEELADAVAVKIARRMGSQSSFGGHVRF